MKFKIFFLSFLAFFLLSVSVVSAAFTISVSLPSKSLTESQQVSVTVTVTNLGTSTESNIVTSLTSSPSWFSVVTECSVISSLSSSQSSTSTCTIRPTSTGSDLSLTSTVESAGGTTGSGSSTGITVSSQSSSLTSSISVPSSASTSSTFYVGLTVTAPSSNDAANVRATTSRSGACTLDTSTVPASQTLGNITKGTSKSPLNWKFTAGSSSGTCSITVNVLSDNAGSASPSASVSVTSSSSSDSGSSSSSGGGGGSSGGGTTTTTIKVVTKEAQVKEVRAGEKTDFSIGDSVLTSITITAKTSRSFVTITMTKQTEKPASVDKAPEGLVYNYLTIDKRNITDADIENATVKFQVEKSWLTQNNINESTVVLNRYSNGWNKLKTTMTGSGANSLSYEAESPGLSVFAITAEKKITEETKEVEKPISPEIPIVIVLITALVFVAGIVFYMKRKPFKAKKRKPQSKSMRIIKK